MKKVLINILQFIFALIFIALSPLLVFVAVIVYVIYVLVLLISDIGLYLYKLIIHPGAVPIERIN